MIQPEEWTIVMVTVDCEAGLMHTYINGKLCRTIHSETIAMVDGKYSVGPQICLFGSKVVDETLGSEIKYLWFQNRALTDTVCVSQSL
jgi:hypothetical protein